MTLVPVESMKLRFIGETKPEYCEPNAAVERAGKNGQPEKPKWGVIHRTSLPGDTNNWPPAPIGSVPVPPDKPRSPWGVLSKGIEW